MPVPFYSPITVPVTPTSEYCLTNKAYVDSAITAAINALHLSDAATKTTTTSVTNGSGALITSGGVYSYIQGLSLANTYAAKVHSHNINSISNLVDLLNTCIQNLTGFHLYHDNVSYAIGDCVIHDGYIWRAVAANGSSDPQEPGVSNDWEQIHLSPSSGSGGGLTMDQLNQTLASISFYDIYDENEPYYPDAVVVYQGRLFHCHTAVSAGEVDPLEDADGNEYFWENAGFFIDDSNWGGGGEFTAVFNKTLKRLVGVDVWSEEDSYGIGDCVVWERRLWRAVTGSDYLDPHNPSEDDGTYWEPVSLSDILGGGVINPIPAQMSIEADNVMQGNDAVIRVTIPSDSGNVTVSCEFDGDTYTGVLDSDDGEEAVYAVTIPSPPVGTWDADVTVTGSDKYTFEPGSTAFTVFSLPNWD